jgi:hypothetical protein
MTGRELRLRNRIDTLLDERELLLLRLERALRSRNRASHRAWEARRSAQLWRMRAMNGRPGRATSKAKTRTPTLTGAAPGSGSEGA